MLGKKEEKNKEEICGPMLNFFVERRKKGTENLLLLREDREKNTGQGAELYIVHFVVSGLNIYILIPNPVLVSQFDTSPLTHC